MAAAAAGGDVTLEGAPVAALGALIGKLKEAGVTVEADEAAGDHARFSAAEGREDPLLDEATALGLW